MTNLVDRYVHTALRRVPEQQRADIDRELRASIEDAVDARVEAGESREAAVEGTLTELGDPDRLADSYADRPQYLIGPELYPAWRRLSVLLLSAVLPVVVAVVVVIQLFDDPAIGKVIAAAVTSALTVGVQMMFWTTLIFFVVERAGRGTISLRSPWSLKDLPRYEPDGLPTHEMAAGLVWPALLIAALILQQFTFSEVPVLDPANWTFWWPYLIVVLILQGVYEVWVWRLGTWNRTVTVVNTVLQLLFTVPLIYLLATGHFFNPEFDSFAGLGDDVDVERWLSLGIIAILLIGTVKDVVEVAMRGERIRKGVPAKVAGSGGGYEIG
ncbi:permease prefix domain 1-containing protein [Actinoplanes sp. CA-030573]|uniref:permease prefix domain 1-containing protein n=1 Tax=Actinoplanes sp. CA-030573 TaxID=3239898 RepID=UPI003D921F66